MIYNQQGSIGKSYFIQGVEQVEWIRNFYIDPQLSDLMSLRVEALLHQTSMRSKRY